MPGSPSPSKKLNPAQQKYSAYNQELVAIYEAVKHFRHMLEAHHFTDHKPITYAFQLKRINVRCASSTILTLSPSSRQTDRHMSGQDVVADALSRVESVTAPPSYDTLAALQDGDDELQTLLGSTTALQLEL
jgi:hypothetical protein